MHATFRSAAGLAIAAVFAVPAAAQTPAADSGAAARLAASPRHGEWVVYPGGAGDSVRAFLVYPERRDQAPVVVVIHDIGGMSDWIRGVADGLAAAGFIAIVPDLLSGKGPNGGGTESLDRQAIGTTIRTLASDEVNRRLQAAGRYATALPSARRAFAVIGFCWGGSTSFAFAGASSDLRGAVVYYGTSPSPEVLANIRAPVLGLYGSDDARVNVTIEPARAELTRLGRRFETEMYEGAGHGFLRNQAGREGANLRAADAAWPRMVTFLREVLR